MSLRTKSAFKLSLTVFFVTFALGLMAILISLPTPTTPAWFFHWLFLILITSLAVGMVNFVISWFVDYLYEQEIGERLKIFFKRHCKEKIKLIFNDPFYYFGSVTFVYFILVLFSLWPNTANMTLSLRAGIVIVTYIIWLIFFMLLWIICVVISYGVKILKQK